jgi:hypothetical protein
MLVAAVGGGCASTTFNATWKAPDARALNFKGRKVAALVVANEDSVRYTSEDTLAHEITLRGAVGVSAYTLIPKELTQDREKAKELFQRAQVAGVIAMRIIGTQTELNSNTAGTWGGPNYSTFWAGGGYYGWAWGGAYDYSYVSMDKVVSVETLVYSMDQDKLVWAGRSETKNPTHVVNFVKELAAKVAASLQREGLIH